MSEARQPTEIVNVIPAHLDSARVRWLASLSTAALESMRANVRRGGRQVGTDQHEAGRLVQAVTFVLVERGPIEWSVRRAMSHEVACHRTLLEIDLQRTAAKRALDEAAAARLRLEAMEDKQ